VVHVCVLWLYLYQQHLFLYDSLVASCLTSCELHCCLLSGTKEQPPATQTSDWTPWFVHHLLFPHDIKITWWCKDLVYNIKKLSNLHQHWSSNSLKNGHMFWQKLVKSQNSSLVVCQEVTQHSNRIGSTVWQGFTQIFAQIDLNISIQFGLTVH
jgi:hypothetical protein